MGTEHVKGDDIFGQELRGSVSVSHDQTMEGLLSVEMPGTRDFDEFGRRRG